MTNNYIFSKLNSSKIFDEVENFESLFALYCFFRVSNTKRIKNHESLINQDWPLILKKHFFDLKIFPNIEWLEQLSVLITKVSYVVYLKHLKANLKATDSLIVENKQLNYRQSNNSKTPCNINFISSQKSRFLRGLIHSCILIHDEEIVQILKKMAINCCFIGGEPLTAIFIKDIVFSLSVLSETKVIEEIFRERNDYKLIKICMPFFDVGEINEIKKGLNAKISSHQHYV